MLCVLMGAAAVPCAAAAGGRPPPALASARTEAKRHFEQGVALYNDGDFNGALAEFQASYEALPSPGVLYNIGLTQKALYRYPEAITTLERYLSETKTAPRERLAEVRQVIAEMRALLSELRLSITPEGASVVLDGRTLGPAPLGPLTVAAGHHVLELNAPDYEPLRKELTVSAGVPLDLKLDLKAVRKIGRARVTATPPTATIRIDGKLVGMGAVDLELEAGGHTVEVSAPGFLSDRSELAISSGQQRTVAIRLNVVAKKTPLVRKWWFWTIIGAAAGGTAAAVAVPLSAKPESPIIGTLAPGAGRVN